MKQQNNQQANDAARAQSTEYEQQGAYYTSHKDEIDKSMDSSSTYNGTPQAKANVAQNNNSSSSNSQTSTNPDIGADTSTKPNYDYSNSKQ